MIYIQWWYVYIYGAWYVYLEFNSAISRDFASPMRDYTHVVYIYICSMCILCTFSLLSLSLFAVGCFACDFILFAFYAPLSFSLSHFHTGHNGKINNVKICYSLFELFISRLAVASDDSEMRDAVFLLVFPS